LNVYIGFPIAARIQLKILFLTYYKAVLDKALRQYTSLILSSGLAYLCHLWSSSQIILSSSYSSTPRLLKSFLFPGAYRTGWRLWL